MDKFKFSHEGLPEKHGINFGYIFSVYS